MLSWCPAIRKPRRPVKSFCMFYKPARHEIEPTRRTCKLILGNHIEVVRFVCVVWVGWVATRATNIIRANDSRFGLQPVHHPCRTPGSLRSSVSIYLGPVARATDGQVATRNWAQQNDSERRWGAWVSSGWSMADGGQICGWKAGKCGRWTLLTWGDCSGLHRL